MNLIKRIHQRFKKRQQPETTQSVGPSLPPITITQNIRENFGKVTGAIIHLPDPNAERLQEARSILLDRVKSHWITAEGAARSRQAALQAIESDHNKFVDGAGLLPLRKRFLPGMVDFVSGATQVVAHLHDNGDDNWDDYGDQNGDDNAQTIPLERSIYALFQAANQALLILGEPGVGKTVTLLQLAREALYTAEVDSTKPVPVILDLAMWANAQLPIAEWVNQELNTVQYGIPKSITQTWLRNNDLLLLFDGLSTLTDLQRRRCVETLNEFTNDYGLSGLVVCSRIEEYQRLPVRLTLHDAIVVEPLSDRQVMTYLDAAGDQLAGLRTAIAKDELLHELAMTPLMLHIMSSTYADVPSAQITRDQEGPAIHGRRQLFDSYIRRMFRYGGQSATPVSNTQSTVWLSWLAQQLDRHKQTMLLIERMQPSWLVTIGQSWLYILITRFIYGLLFGLLFALLFLLSQGLILGIYFVGDERALPKEALPILARSFLPVWGISGLVLGVVELFWWSRLGIGPVVRHVSNYRRVAQRLMKALLYVGTISMVGGSTFALWFGWWTGGLFYGLSFGVLGGLFLALSERGETLQNEIKTVERLQISWVGAARGVLSGILIGGFLGFGLDVIAGGQLFFWFGKGISPNWLRQLLAAISLAGPVIALCGILFGGFRGVLLTAKIRPNQGMWLSGRNALYAGFVCTIIGWLLAFTYAQIRPELATGGPLSGLSVGFFFGVLAMLWHGGLDLIQHSVLRLILYCQGVAPLNYAQFLDYSVERVFLRRVGGGYMFVNRPLMEHFAKIGPNMLAEPPQVPAKEERALSNPTSQSEQILQSRSPSRAQIQTIPTQLASSWQTVSSFIPFAATGTVVAQTMAGIRWHKLLARLSQLLGIVLVTVVIIYLLWMGYHALPETVKQLTGLHEASIPEGATVTYYRELPNAKTLWDWFDLLIVPVLLVIGGFLFNRAQQRNEQRAVEQREAVEQRLLESRAQETALQSYFDRMAELMLDYHLGKIQLGQGTLEQEDADAIAMSHVRQIARIRTLTVLRRLDGTRKKYVLQFLHDTELISGEEPVVVLAGADLRNADLKSIALPQVNLSGALLNDAELNGAILTEANLTRTRMYRTNLNGAQLQQANVAHAVLHEATLRSADLEGAVLSSADLLDADLFQANLQNVTLTQAKLKRTNLQQANLETADLTGTDLAEADITGAKLKESISHANLEGEHHD